MDLSGYPQGINVLIAGASGGIGLAFTRQLLTENKVNRVFATHRGLSPTAELVALKEQYSEKLDNLSLDITEESQVAAIAQRIGEQVERLHLVVNCVGILHDGDFQPEKSLRHIQADNLLRYFQVNSIGAILLVKYLILLLKHSERSVMATISAIVGSMGDNQVGGWYGYRASKAALNMLLRTAAIEYKRTSPRTIVVMLHPGTTNTQLSKPFQRNVPPEKLFSCDRTVTQLLAVVDQLTEKDSGEFFSWDGSRLPW